MTYLLGFAGSLGFRVKMLEGFDDFVTTRGLVIVRPKEVV